MDSVTATASSAAPVKKGVFNFTFAPNVTPDTFVTTVSTASAATPGGSDEASAASPQSSTPGSSAQLFPPSSPRGRTNPKRPTHAKRRGSGHIPRPPNAFILFRAEFVKNRHIPDTIETQHSGLSKIVGACWRKLPFEERAIWEEKAKSASEEHKEKHPGYKYRPAPARTSSKKTSAPSKRESAAQKPIQITAPAQQAAQVERKVEDVAQLLLNGKRGSELDAAFNDLQRERTLRQPPPPPHAFPPFAAGPFGYLPPYLQHRRSSSAPPAQNAQTFAPMHRNSIVYAHNDSHLDAAPLASLAVRSLALEPAMGSFGLSPNMMDSSSPPPLMSAPVHSGDADAIAAELFGAFTQNPFAPADTLGQTQQPSSDANFNFPPPEQAVPLSQLSDVFDPSFMAGNFASMDSQFPGPMDPGAQFTYDLSAFPQDSMAASSSDLATWANLPVNPSPPADMLEMPELLDPSSVQYPADYGAWAPQSHANPAQYTQYNSQPAYYSGEQHPSAAYAPQLATDGMSFSPSGTYESSSPVTPIIEPEEKALYQFVKNNMHLISPTPTAAYGIPDFLANAAY
ncbi:hypothetical protein AURDEDRAFT_116678 [Auricularia subglabra TFB-10046 SS5]|nr:hypothetical protein AURDEDRAFT_116678 [Auricularia subglabra TFB-10046 SS5]